MKNILFISLICSIVLSCCNTKNAVAQQNKTSQMLTSCPENIDCTLDVFDGKSMVVKTDDIGAVFYELEDQPEKTVYVYTYRLKTDTKYQDGDYREEIIFELNSKATDFSLSDEKLQSAKMLFGVWCYCKGKAGNYKLTKGNFSKKGNEISIDFPAVVSDQKVTELKIKI